MDGSFRVFFCSHTKLLIRWLDTSLNFLSSIPLLPLFVYFSAWHWSIPCAFWGDLITLFMFVLPDCWLVYIQMPFSGWCWSEFCQWPLYWSVPCLFALIFLNHNLELRAFVKAPFSPENFVGSQKSKLKRLTSITTSPHSPHGICFMEAGHVLTSLSSIEVTQVSMQ